MGEWEQQLLHFTQTLEFEHFCLMVEKFETLKDILVWLELDNTAGRAVRATDLRDDPDFLLFFQQMFAGRDKLASSH